MKRPFAVAACVSGVLVVVAVFICWPVATSTKSAKANQIRQASSETKIRHIDPGSLPAPPTRQPAPPSAAAVAAQNDANILARAFELAQSDPQQAFEFIEDSVPPALIQKTRAELVIRLGKQSLQGLPQLLNFIRDTALRTYAVQTIARDRATTDPRSMFDFAQQNLNAPDATAAGSVIANHLTNTSHFEDAAYVVSQMAPGSQITQNEITNLVRRWAPADSLAAAQWVLTLSPKEQDLTAKTFLQSASSPKDIEAILQLVEGTKSASVQNQGIERAVGLLVESRDLDGARNWVSQVPAQFQPKARAALIAADETDSVAALTPMAVSISDPGARDQAIRALLSRQFMQDPAGAASWVQQLPSSLQNGTVQDLTARWCRADSAEAYRWLQSLPVGPLKDQGLRAFIAATKDTNPQAAALAQQQIRK